MHIDAETGDTRLVDSGLARTPDCWLRHTHSSILSPDLEGILEGDTQMCWWPSASFVVVAYFDFVFYEPLKHDTYSPYISLTLFFPGYISQILIATFQSKIPTIE